VLQARPPTPVPQRTFPDVGIAEDGSAMAVWQWRDPNPSGFKGVRSRRHSGTSWGPVTDIASGFPALSSSRALAARIAVGALGHGFITLPTGDMKQYAPFWGWVSLPTDVFSATRTSLDRAVDGAGSLMYLYESGGMLRVRRYASQWETSDWLGMSTPSPHLASNAYGDFGAIFGTGRTYSLLRDAPEGGSFSDTAAPVAGVNGGRVGVSKKGQVLSVWIGPGNTVNFARLNTTSITTPITVASYASGAVSNLRLAVNGAGRAIASWVHAASFNYEVVASIYTPTTGWSAPVILAPSAIATLGGVPNVEVGIDSCGNAQLVHEDLGYKGYAFYYQPGLVGWGPRHTFSGPVLDIRIATAANGISTAVWDNDQSEVISARFQ
jgi:hypothetical protein